MNRTLSLDQLREQIRDIDERLTELSKLGAERARIQDLIRAWEKAFPEESKDAPINKANRLMQRSRERTEDYAHQALVEAGPLFPNQLLGYVRQMGWKSHNDDKKDADRIYQAMKRRPERFQRMSDGRWAALMGEDEGNTLE
jgi:hypothetical protein